MMPVRIRHANPPRTIRPEPSARDEMRKKGESIMNPSRTLVTDSKRQKVYKYSKKHTLSLSIYKSVTYPPARCACTCARTREGGRRIRVTDSMGDLPCQSVVTVAGSFTRTHLPPSPTRFLFRRRESAAVGNAAANLRPVRTISWRPSRWWRAMTGAVRSNRCPLRHESGRSAPSALFRRNRYLEKRLSPEARGNSGQSIQSLFRLSGLVFRVAQDSPSWAVGERTRPRRTGLPPSRPVVPGRRFWASLANGGAAPGLVNHDKEVSR